MYEGFSYNMWSWRWRCRAGAFRGALAVMLLGLGFAQTVHQQDTCPAAEAPRNLTQPLYKATAKEGPGVGFLSALVQSFLNTVQSKPFPKDLVLKIIRDPNVLSDNESIKEALVYEVGFLVCIAIGILYIVLMPIVGLFLACCRCCGNCGGKMYQKQTSSIHCHRRTLYLGTFVTTVIIFAGNICMFRSNEALKVSVEQGPVELRNTISNIGTFFTAVPKQVDDVVDESSKAVYEVTRNLDAIGAQLGTEIQRRFRGTLDPALHSVKRLNQEISNTSVQLDKLNLSLAELQSSADRLQANITAVKNEINQTLSNPRCRNCSNISNELQKLTLDTTITTPSLREFQSAVDEVIQINLQSKIDEVNQYFDSIPQRVTNDTKDVVQSSKRQLDDIKGQISEVSSEIQLSALGNVSGSLDQVQSEIDRVLPEVERAEHIRWAVCVALSCAVLLVVVCDLLGLVLGPLGLNPKADPKKRSCTADCGGTFLMMGAGFSFLFSWLLMLLVLLLFLLGGNVYTLLCRPWNNGQLLKFIDTSGLIAELKVDPALGLQNISDIYRDCENNQPLWTTFHLNERVDLDDLLNVSKYTAQIQRDFESMNITLTSITFLSPEIKNQLGDASAKAQNFDATALTQQMNNVSNINLNTTADKLELFSRSQEDDIKGELFNEAMKLRKIQSDIETIIIPQLGNLNSSMRSLQSTPGKINGTVGEVLSRVGTAQDFLNTNTTQIVKTESRKFLNCQLDYFTTYADWAKLTITRQVGRCGPVASAVDSAEVILCSNILEPLNAFWFSMGWCMIFFIPSIIFSIKLSKHYRRMKYTDDLLPPNVSVHNNHIMMNHIPRAQMKFA
ncbi:prominin-2 [Odontesthes bonariensis]|uniref:prominin-2 n=1 Tax=Odontesthes bonariensis TaxID=219752 RepID=UPI003F582579